jgi:5-formyltetrahydrofolate cyclo-ligase
MMNNSKNKIRQSIRAKRHTLSVEQQNKAAEQVFKYIAQLHRYHLSQHIAFYLSTQSELNPEQILLNAYQAGKKCYLPVLHSQKINTLCFLPYAPGDKLVANRFGILEPAIEDVKNTIPVWQLELVFVPLVAFDKDLNRLGMGKGYYDRTFEFLRQPSAHKPFLIGLGYAMQEVEQLAFEPHDVKLDMVVTESKQFY